MLLQRQSLTIRPLTTAHLAQTMSLLELNNTELRQKIEAEISSNPALELIEERCCPTCGRRISDRGVCPICSHPPQTGSDEPIVFLSSRDEFFTSRNYRSGLDDLPEDETTPAEEDLTFYVLRQIAPELSDDERPIAAHILTSLNEDGLLEINPLEIARYHFVPLEKVQRVLHLIQHAEPYGVGCQTPQEALLVQLEVLKENQMIPPLAYRAVQEGLHLMSRHRYAELGRLLGISKSEARSLAQFITGNLNPYPARSHWGTSETPTPNYRSEVYYYPDVIISLLQIQDETQLVVEVALPFRGTLRINPLFREALRQAPDEKVEHWRAELEHAALLVKCIQQRNQTMVRLMQRLVSKQKDYILNGDEYLIPQTRAQLAKELNLHESTISRAVSDKAVQLPNGRIIPLAHFFDRSLQVRAVLKEIIEQESRPLSDAQIVDLLRKEGYNIKRRTVAKYRSMEGILPARLRTRINQS